MSGWIKMQYGLWDNPKVVRIMSACEVDQPRVIGACFRLWSLADQYTQDGRLDGYDAAVIDVTVGVDGFAAAMEGVGWLVIEAQTVIVPRFEKHHGTGAKRRALDAKRKKSGRESASRPHDVGNASASDADKNGTRDRVRDREAIPPPPTPSTAESEIDSSWRGLEEEVFRRGVNASKAAVAAARERGWGRDEVRTLLAEFDAAAGGYEADALYQRLTGELAGWPQPTRNHTRQQQRAADQQRQRDVTAANAETSSGSAGVSGAGPGARIYPWRRA